MEKKSRFENVMPSQAAVTGIRIQAAREAQIHEITQLEKQSFNEPYPESLIAELVNSNTSCFLVATQGNRITGYAVAKLSPPTAHLISICVSDDVRRRGLGKLLMIELERTMLAASIKSAILEVEEMNQAAIHLYESLGYRRTYVEKDYYGLGRNAVIYQKRLAG